MLKGGMHAWRDAGLATVKAPPPSPAQRGHTLFSAQCSTCHQGDGKGIPGHFPPLVDDAVVNLVDPTAMTSIVLFGGHDGKVGGVKYPIHMPGFSATLNDQEIAELETFVRANLGNHAPAVTPAEVARIRAAAPKPEPSKRK